MFSYFLMKGMEKAVEHIVGIILEKRPIGIYGVFAGEVTGLVHFALIVLVALTALALLAAPLALASFLASRSMIAQVLKSMVLLR